MRAERRKSHPWWWDNHISLKSSKWMVDNMNEMDRSVKLMLKLIEGEGDSFAKKAEMYYQKRPELVSLVGDFNQMYKSLAERYNHLTGELRKTVPTYLHSFQSSSAITEHAMSEQITLRRLTSRRNTHRAAGFDFFLGSAGVSFNDLNTLNKEVEHSSLSSLDSDLDSADDASSSAPLVNGNGAERLREVDQGNRNGGNAKTTDNNNRNYEKFLNKIARYEDELRITNEKLKSAEEEISRLKRELEDNNSMRITRNSQDEIELAQKDIQVVEINNKFDLQEQISGLETSVSTQDSGSLIEILKTANERVRTEEDEIERFKFELQNKTQERNSGREEIANMGWKSSAEKERLEAEISKVTEEHSQLEEKVREWEWRGRSLEEEIQRLTNGIAQKSDDLVALNKDFDVLKLKYEMLVEERDGLKSTVESMMAEVSCRDDGIEEMEGNMKKLHIEQMEMLAGAERGRKVVGELGKKVRELEEEVERQRITISNAEEEKREAIRQLCFSLDHYRDGYTQLRQAFVGTDKGHSVIENHESHSVMAS